MNFVSGDGVGSCTQYAGISLQIGICSEANTGLSVYMRTLKKTEEVKRELEREPRNYLAGEKTE